MDPLIRHTNGRAIGAFVALIAVWTPWQGAAAASVEDEDLAQVYGGKGFVSIATGSVQPTARAPAVASVITAAEIVAMGARSVEDVLAQVPGLHVSRSTNVNSPIYSFRGIHTQLNPQVLVLVDDLPSTSVFLGDRGVAWGSVPVEMISRIEIIRGPGSALYGADALTGVINIITKSPEELEGGHLSIAGGSFRTGELFASYGSASETIRYLGYFYQGRTSGADRTILADQQTMLDQVFGTSVSRAPGSMSLSQRSTDIGVKAYLGDWSLRMAYKKRSDVGTGAGLSSTLDPEGRGWGERFGADLQWRNRDWFRDWELSLRANYDDYYEKADLVLFPPGAFGGAFPDGMRGSPFKWERHAGLSGAATYAGFRDHRLRLGAGYQKLDLYRVEEAKNYELVAIPGIGTVPMSLGGVVDVSDVSPFLRPHSRIVRYIYGQDEWTIARDWVLTAGIRHDRYSDFGGTTNPRVALVWEAAYNVTAKLLYGRAFRAPSFVELYAINNPVAIGNASLKPETIETHEAAVTWQVNPALQFGANAYAFRMKDVVRQVANADPSTGNTAQNTGELVGRGVELEFAWDATRQLRISGNYSHQQTWDPDTGKDPGLAPRNRAFLRGDWRFAPGWSLNAQTNWVADRRRESSDLRGPIADYALTDVALRTESPNRQWSITLAVKNAFDVDAREPSPAPGLLPYDIPLPGRQLVLQGDIAF
ncbi:MAG: TonB-dependent receptor [Zoogloeaceae bacterium]|nr:TonB-dependent receptor [Zoogloeaceae bacterium]